jgi:hypothetical protein
MVRNGRWLATPVFVRLSRAARVQRHGMSGVIRPRYDFQGQLTLELALLSGNYNVDKAKAEIAWHMDLSEQSKRQPQALQKVAGAMCGC